MFDTRFIGHSGAVCRSLSFLLAASFLATYPLGCGLRRAKTNVTLVQTIEEPPRLVSQPTPAYPFSAREQGLEGDVLLAMTVDTAGTVKRVDILQGAPVFRDAARAAALSAVFIPATVNGVPIPYRVIQRLSFRLENAETPSPPLPLWEADSQPVLMNGEALRASARSLEPDAYGDVLVRMVIGSKGKVASVRLLMGSFAVFDAAREALYALRYRPAQQGMFPVGVAAVAVVSVRESGIVMDIRNRAAPLYDYWKVDVPPVFLGEGPSGHPPEERRGAPSGDVHVGMIIDTTGNVEAAWIIGGPPKLRQRALETARGFHYVPARHEGRAVRVWLARRMNFSGISPRPLSNDRVPG